ncbi:Cation/H+ exchanger [Dillenia turbinata]|uniref:Cation/H+ exchanger n=1 Tax=Dillenia turbinata TaxID=194707 RepID=A0AAN8ZFB8_9MAGN
MAEGFQGAVESQILVPDPTREAGVRVHPIICQPKTSLCSLGIYLGDNPSKFAFPLMLLEISLLILITRIVRCLLRPLKQPKVVSEIIGGIIIGPSVLGRSKTFQSFMFPGPALFIVRNVGLLGFIYFLFISGVKIDLSLIRSSGRKQLSIGFLGVLFPFVTTVVVAMIMRQSFDKEMAKFSSIGAVASSLAITAVPVLFPILKELNLLSSEIGRFALSTSIVSDFIGVHCVAAFEASKQGESEVKDALLYLVFVIVLMTLVMNVLRPLMARIIRNTPDGKQVDNSLIIKILLGVLLMSFTTDLVGAAIGNGALWLGLAIPDGPPLGATLVERSETFVSELLMPFAFAYVGLFTDWYTLSGQWSALRPLFYMTVAGYATKFLVTFATSLFFRMPLRDCLTLSLIMSLRGQVEYLLFIHWYDYKMLRRPTFTMMVLLTTAITAVATPFISTLYKPTRPYMINKRRTIQHTAQTAEVVTVGCIYDQESVSDLINILDISNPTLSSPFVVYALCLVELIGGAMPMLIDHDNPEQPSKYHLNHTIYNALKHYQESKGGLIELHSFTAISPVRTMYQNICEVALVKKATLIILPFCRARLNGLQLVDANVLAHAPCSVAVFVDKSSFRNTRKWLGHNFVMLFLGGADAREALSYADRMAMNPDVELTVVRFLSHNGRGDSERERKLDDGTVTWFWVKNEENPRVEYREVVVRDGEETVAAIQEMKGGSYDLWILGRSQGINPRLLSGLTEWSENQELGVLGDYIASNDFGGMASVLVMQQQILRDGGAAKNWP